MKNNKVNEINPLLVQEWNFEKNFPLKPSDITAGSKKDVWWKCHRYHEWKAKIYSRNNGHGCPYCSGRFATAENNLQILNPELAKEWNSERNLGLTPDQIKPNSEKVVWWKCQEEHEWQDKIRIRNNGKQCPKCNEIIKNKNCLAKIRPDLAAEWDEEKNFPFTPYDVSPRASNKVWWKCSNEHSWEAHVYARKNSGCPYCSGRRATEKNNLKLISPQLASQWHYEKNGQLTPENVKAFSNKKVWWRCDRKHEWKASIDTRSQGTGCPVCAGKVPHKDNCLATVKPELAAEWNWERNHPLTPDDVTESSRKKVWWKCSKQHDWQAFVYNRSIGNGCPFCSGKAVNVENCLATIYPEIASEWDNEKNYPLTPTEVTYASGKKVWWKCKFGHSWATSVCNRSKGTNCPGCSSQSSLIELALYSEFKSIFPNAKNRFKIKTLEVDIFIPEYQYGIEYDGCYWHKDEQDRDLKKNIKLKQEGINLIRIREKGLKILDKHDLILEGSVENFRDETIKNIVVYVLKKLPYNDLFSNVINNYLNSRLLMGVDIFNDLKKSFPGQTGQNNLKSINPNLALEWHSTLNGLLTPTDVAPFSRRKAWWACKEGHVWETAIANRSGGSGCPQCYKESRQKSKKNHFIEL